MATSASKKYPTYTATHFDESNIAENTELFIYLFFSHFLLSLQIDMEDEREVRREDAAALAKFYNISYIETSSMRGINVEEAFRTITQEVYDKVNTSLPILPPGVP